MDERIKDMELEDGIQESSEDIHEEVKSEYPSDDAQDFKTYKFAGYSTAEGNREFSSVDIQDFKEGESQEYGLDDEDRPTLVLQEMVKSMRENIYLYSGRNSSPRPISIYKVPAKLRRVNEEAYTPRLVSIGPIHHGVAELQSMERFKWRFLDKYLEKTGLSLDFIAKVAMDMEHSVRQCYQDSFDNLTSKAFSEMILLDGIFLLVLFQKFQIAKEMIGELGENSAGKGGNTSKTSAQSAQSTSDHISQNLWVRSDVLHDIMLLENQLPFFVLQQFYEVRREIGLNDHIFYFFFEVGSMAAYEITSSSSNEPKHLVDFLRRYHCPEQPQEGQQTEYTRTATELYEAGVRFRKRIGSRNLFDIQLVYGELAVPTLRIDEHTETFFRNLIAFEKCQCDIRARKVVTSYVILLRSLVSTPKDVDLLVGCGIIDNSLGDHEQVARLFNNLHKKTARDEKDFYFGALCNEMNEYSRDYCHQWMADCFRWRRVLRRDYFSNPWTSISVIAAIILLCILSYTSCRFSHLHVSVEALKSVRKVQDLMNLRLSSSLFISPLISNMETELNGLLELPQVHKDDSREFVTVDVEEDDREEDIPIPIPDPVPVESKDIELMNSIIKNLSLHTSRPSYPISIHKVPAKLRKVNEAAYTPRSVSIDPIHYGRPEL